MSEKGRIKKFTKKPIKGCKYTLMVSSAKGGVGKSTVAINIMFSLQTLGLKVGMLDADVFGPSLPKLIKLNKKPESVENKFIKPLRKYDAQFISLGFLIEEMTPMIWRGPMVISALKTLTEKVLWDDIDCLIIDMPPGTGDTQLTFAQDVKIDGAIIISTPQELALIDVKRGIKMFEKTGINIFGLIENMSYFEDDQKKIHKIFGESLVEKTALDFNKKFLGKIPVHQDISKSADSGQPMTKINPEHPVSKKFLEIAKKIKQDFH